MVNFAQPESNPKRFFGLGERDGPFFLTDKTRYSLFTNSQNLKDRDYFKQDIMNFGKNGFFPYIFS